MMFHGRDQEQSWYDTAQICLNGHVMTSAATTFPKLKRQFCDRCGAATITECPKCGANIRGYYHVPGVFNFDFRFSAPKFCSDCGAAYPWTESSLRAAHNLAEEIEQLSEEDRNIITDSLDELVKETPQTEVAAIRVRKIMHKVDTETADALKRIIVDIVGEAAKKAILGP
jgi:hypothetical protein